MCREADRLGLDIDLDRILEEKTETVRAKLRIDSEYLTQEAISEKSGILINGVNTNNIRYADDTVILAESEEQLQAMLDRIIDKCKE
ncbi:catenin (Cadherin-associated protein), alpha 3 [Elysia marginata]|uniref:Catenin (Cadherin-associated protein), alpha 3 n=1 Tax=Elysia marginata TaxID=1093978 RepID=A0AAV4FUW3_9GAST|nr:catenin (Cadherin-associated protein), alpha 3 [Elysia marginata]